MFGVALVGYLLVGVGRDGMAAHAGPVLHPLRPRLAWRQPRSGWTRPTGRIATSARHTVQNVFSVAAVGMVWLVASRALGGELLAPFCLAWGVSFGFTGVERMRRSRPRWSAFRMGTEAAWRGALLTVAPLALVWALRAVAGTEAAPDHLGVSVFAVTVLAALAVGGGAAVLARWGRVIDDESTAFMGRVYRAALVLPLSALALAAGVRSWRAGLAGPARPADAELRRIGRSERRTRRSTSSPVGSVRGCAPRRRPDAGRGLERWAGGADRHPAGVWALVPECFGCLGIGVSERRLVLREASVEDAVFASRGAGNGGTEDHTAGEETVWAADLISGDADASDDRAVVCEDLNAIAFGDEAGMGPDLAFAAGQTVGVSALGPL